MKIHDTNETHVAFHCPGCDFTHVVDTTVWQFDGNYESPTIRPSIVCEAEFGEMRKMLRCHSFVTNGRIEFLADCTHRLAGKSVDLPEWPGIQMHSDA